MSKKPKIPDFESIGEQLKVRIRKYAKVYCLNFFTDSFRQQGFTDVSFEAWENRKAPDRRPGGAILVDTTFLRNSLQVLEETENTIEFGTYVPYAAVHNNGLRLRSIQNVRGFHRTRNGNREQVKPHFRKQDTQYPARPFIKHSTQMMQHLNDWFLEDIVKQFNEPSNTI